MSAIHTELTDRIKGLSDALTQPHPGSRKNLRPGFAA